MCLSNNTNIINDWKTNKIAKSYIDVLDLCFDFTYNCILLVISNFTLPYRVCRPIQFYHIGKHVYFFISFSLNILTYPEVPLPSTDFPKRVIFRYPQLIQGNFGLTLN